ncbi:poly(ADP-ribose) glycohydrolase-like isoform X2 [Neocloeon triangulifer]|uniref:poly(ADP-ribose) glycohydrolase-like isoform X2 n=1 Tax=Neocloeon triangulifer TaxID=2078957 RepID=UPI00286EE7B8|nr:poly(ADP-ribose) glycohydrolase-like isoform X2 [Neocloeon triangulifer]
MSKRRNDTMIDRTEAPKKAWKGYSSSYDLEFAIRAVAQDLDVSVTFENLHTAIEEMAQRNYQEAEHFLRVVVPKLEELAKEVDFPDQPYLFAGTESTVELTKEQIARILASAFFCTFPPNYDFEEFSFKRLYTLCNNSDSKVSKLQCIFQYFKAVTSDDFQAKKYEKVTFHRICETSAIGWKNSNKYLTKFEKNDASSMFDCPSDEAQVDFANKHIGGGILGRGCVQEEIKFALCPELIVSRLFCQPLKNNEALIMTGATPYSKGVGYGRQFKYAGPADTYYNSSKTVIAIDALNFSGRNSPDNQYKKDSIDRELLKAYAGFSRCPLQKIATGNWGGGAFKGDAELKMIIQWLAASMAAKELVYYCYNDRSLKELFDKTVHTYRGKTIGEAYKLMMTKHCTNYKNKIPSILSFCFAVFPFLATIFLAFQNYISLGGETVQKFFRGTWLGGTVSFLCKCFWVLIRLFASPVRRVIRYFGDTRTLLSAYEFVDNIDMS